MHSLWLITNPHSGSATAEKCDAIEAVCKERGLGFTGRTSFPDEPMPIPGDLGDADTVLLFAGDGTINAALRSLEGWPGAVLILPGGTMNMLAKRLHGDAEPHDIIHAAHERPRTTILPYVEASGERAYVGMIAGPVTAWAEAREAVRESDLAHLPDKVGGAWQASWDGDIAIHDGARMLGRYQAAFAQPRDGGIALSGIAAERITDLARLGWAWATGDWHAAGNVDDTLTPTAILTSAGGVSALMDGEPVALKSPATLGARSSELRFLTTL